MDSVVWQDCTASPRLPRDACIVLVYIGRHIIQIHVHSRCKDMARKEIKKASLAMTLNKGIRVHVFFVLSIVFLGKSRTEVIRGS